MRTRYRIDDYQQNYFVIESFEDLLRQTRDADFGPIYDRLRGLEPIEVGTLLPGDSVIHAGTQAYAQAKAVS
jgi:phenylalanine-4-hydroxylase